MLCESNVLIESDLSLARDTGPMQMLRSLFPGAQAPQQQSGQWAMPMRLPKVRALMHARALIRDL